MAFTRGDRAIFDLKRWEFCAPAPTATVAGSFVASSPTHEQAQMYVAGNTSAWLYFPFEDSWVALPSPALGGTFGAGAAGCAVSWSVGSSTMGTFMLAATGGTTTTITTNQPLARDLRGYKVQIVDGPNAGQTKTIASNTIGANATITFTEASATAFSSANTYILRTPSWYVLGSGTLVSSSFRKYDFATNTWVTEGVTNFFTSLSVDGRLTATPDFIGTDYVNIDSGTATSATNTTLTDTSKNWGTNVLSQTWLWIISGTGVGQVQAIVSNTSDTVVLSATWTTNPDNTSVYAIRPRGQNAYFVGNNSLTLKIYLTTGFWADAGNSRASNSAAGCSLNWCYDSNNPISSFSKLYSFSGGNGSSFQVFDIGGSSWVSGTTNPSGETFTTGSRQVTDGKDIYLQKDATGRWLRYDTPTYEMTGWGSMLYPQGAAIAGNTSFLVTHKDGATTTKYVHMILNSSAVHLRQMVI